MQITHLSKKNLELFKVLGALTTSVRTWSDEELAGVWTLTNLIYNTEGRDDGCSGCRRERVNLLRQAWDAFSGAIDELLKEKGSTY